MERPERKFSLEKNHINQKIFSLKEIEKNIKIPKLEESEAIYKISETKLEVDADVIKANTIEIQPRRFAKLISGECMLDLNENQSIKWDMN
jgi:hypothetical protein